MGKYSKENECRNIELYKEIKEKLPLSSGGLQRMWNLKKEDKVILLERLR